MTGYCRLCRLRVAGPPAPRELVMDAAARGRSELLGLGVLMLSHLMKEHPGAFETAANGLGQLQALMGAFFLEPAPAAPAGGPVEAFTFTAERDKLKAEMVGWLSQDEPVSVNRVQPAGGGGAA